MTAVAFDWFEDESPRDLKRWALAAAIVVGIHVFAVGGYLYVHAPSDVGNDEAPIVIDLAPPDDQPETPPPEVEQKPEEPPPPPPPEETQTQVSPPPEQMPVEEPKPPPAPPPPPKRDVVRAQTAYEAAIRRHLGRYLPANARETEQGTVHVSFSIDRTGHVLERHIIRSSGHAELDNAALNMVDRAQPFPPFPAVIPDTEKIVEFPLHFGQ
jgi:protein TonB